MNRTRIAPRTYVDDRGRFWARYPVNRRYTWRLLRKVKNKREAIAAAQSINEPRADSFAALAALYVAAGCPNRRMEARTAEFIRRETVRVNSLVKWFGPMLPDNIRLPLLPQYATWRMRQCRTAGKGQRTVDMDLNTLSNVLQYGITTQQIEQNHIRHNRPRFRRAADVNHSRQRMPESAEEIHRLSAYFLEFVKSEVFAWMNYFQMFTGCRTVELLRLRMSAPAESAGHIANGYLHLGRRAKSGVNPWCPIGPEFQQMLDCFHRWHRARFPKSAWFFPGLSGNVVDPGSHGHALVRACRELGLHHITPHGFRAFCATKMLRDGRTQSEVAAHIGDKTPAIIGSTYGDCPGGAKLSFTPADGLPSWMVWRSPASKLAKIA